jgi:methionine-rich copper-binding protein CopC
MRRLRRRVLVGVLAGVAWLPVLAHPAGAHGELAEAEPPPNASLAASPGRIRIVLTERPNPLSRLSLIGPGGQRVELGQTRVTGRALEATVGPLPSGTYTLRWAAFSDEDGHLIDDSYRFQVGPGRLAEAPAGQPGLGALLAIVSRLVLLAGALLWTGSLMLGPLVERTGASSPSLVAFAHRLQGIGRWAVLATLLGEIVNLWAASGAGLEVWSGSFLLGSGTGRLVLGRLTVLAVGSPAGPAPGGGGYSSRSPSATSVCSPFPATPAWPQPGPSRVH